MRSPVKSNSATMDDLVERGQSTYRQRLASILEPSHLGEFVAVEPDSSRCFLGCHSERGPCCRSRRDAQQPVLPHARW